MVGSSVSYVIGAEPAGLTTRELTGRRVEGLTLWCAEFFWGTLSINSVQFESPLRQSNPANQTQFDWQLPSPNSGDRDRKTHISIASVIDTCLAVACYKHRWPLAYMQHEAYVSAAVLHTGDFCCTSFVPGRMRADLVSSAPHWNVFKVSVVGLGQSGPRHSVSRQHFPEHTGGGWLVRTQIRCNQRYLRR